MVKATPENVFVGSVVIKKKEAYNVYKVNKNFVYAGIRSTNIILKEWKFKKKGVTWIGIMEMYKAKKLNFNNLNLDETKTEAVVEKKNPTSKKEVKGKYVDACCIKELEKLFKRYHLKQNYKYIVECKCNKNIFAMIGYENDTMAFSRDYKQLLFNYDTKEVTLIKDIAKVS